MIRILLIFIIISGQNPGLIFLTNSLDFIPHLHFLVCLLWEPEQSNHHYRRLMWIPINVCSSPVGWCAPDDIDKSVGVGVKLQINAASGEWVPNLINHFLPSSCSSAQVQPGLISIIIRTTADRPTPAPIHLWVDMWRGKKSRTWERTSKLFTMTTTCVE